MGVIDKYIYEGAYDVRSRIGEGASKSIKGQIYVRIVYSTCTSLSFTIFWHGTCF